MRWVFCALLIFSSMTLSAQKRTIFRETFDDNKKEWFEGEASEGTVEASLSNGAYVVEMKEMDRWQYFGQTIEIDPTENYRVTARFRQKSGEDGSSFGFAFNTLNADNNYHFLIRSRGEASVARYKEGEHSMIAEWKDRKAIKGQGEWNTLEIVRENDAVSCFVNGQFCGGFSYSYYAVFGDYLGIWVWDEQETEMDDLIVVQWPKSSIDVIQGADPSARPVNIGSGVNGTTDEVVDCMSPDGSTIVFSRKEDPNNVGNSQTSDIYMSARMPNGSWSPAINLGAPLNNPQHNFGIALTQDLNTLFIQGTYNSDGTSSTNGLSYTTRLKSGWSAPVAMPVDDFYNNADIYNNSHISSDGSVLVYSLEREDTRGGTDLYVCFRKDDGGWTAPKNLGDSINTIGYDTGPYIAADGKTMYFASNGHPGYEGLDIFVTVRKDDSWLNWTKPKNLGKPINTDEHDVFFQVPARGDSGYYSSTKNAIGSYDIFSIALPKAARPEALFLVKGRVLNATTKEPIEAEVIYESLDGTGKQGVAKSSPVDGAYRAALVNGKLYGVHAKAEGYYPLSEQFDARNLGEYTEVERDLMLTPIVLNVAIRLNNVFFDVGKYDLRPESYPELDRLIEFMKKNTKVKIALSGHTDNVGSDGDNLSLSQNRINSVKAYLVGHDIADNRMTAKGYGESKPVASNDTEDGRQQNRRVEFTIVEK